MPATAAAGTSNAAATLIDALIASNRGDRHAFEFARKTYSYQDVAALMNRTGNLIRGLGVATSGRVLLLLPGSPAFVAGLLGVMKAGAVPVVGAPHDDGDALAQCVAAIAPAAALVHQTYLGQASRGLAAIPHGGVVAVGANVDGYTSFVDAVRTQPSAFARAGARRRSRARHLEWRGPGHDHPRRHERIHRGQRRRTGQMRSPARDDAARIFQRRRSAASVSRRVHRGPRARAWRDPACAVRASTHHQSTRARTRASPPTQARSSGR
jgi:hypothetical protein